MARPDVRDRRRPQVGTRRGGGKDVKARLLAAAGAVAACAALLTGSAGGATSFVAGTDCLEHQAFVDGDDAGVTARLPKRYTPVRDGNGRPLVFARALHCNQTTIDGRTAPATLASIGVVIESPDGVGCGSGVPGVGGATGTQPPLCNWYTLFWASDNRSMVKFLRAGTPGVRAVYVPDLVFQPGATFHFEAKAPSPFTIDDVS